MVNCHCTSISVRYHRRAYATPLAGSTLARGATLLFARLFVIITDMQILPVLDLLNGIVVRGVGGRRDEYRPGRRFSGAALVVLGHGAPMSGHERQIDREDAADSGLALEPDFPPQEASQLPADG